MKTLKVIPITILFITFLLSQNLSACVLNHEVESTTENHVQSTTLNNKYVENLCYSMEKEKYIDDIPFNTESIAKRCFSEEAMKVNFDFEEKSFVNDCILSN